MSYLFLYFCPIYVVIEMLFTIDVAFVLQLDIPYFYISSSAMNITSLWERRLMDLCWILRFIYAFYCAFIAVIEDMSEWVKTKKKLSALWLSHWLCAHVSDTLVVCTRFWHIGCVHTLLLNWLCVYIVTVTLVVCTHCHCRIVCVHTLSLSHWLCAYVTVELVVCLHCHCHNLCVCTLSLSHWLCVYIVTVTLVVCIHCHCRIVCVHTLSLSHWLCAYIDAVTMVVCIHRRRHIGIVNTSLLSYWLCAYIVAVTLVLWIHRCCHIGCVRTSLLSHWLCAYIVTVTMVVCVHRCCHIGMVRTLLLSYWLCVYNVDVGWVTRQKEMHWCAVISYGHANIQCSHVTDGCHDTGSSV